jgi:hypothetical protein
MCMWVDLEWSRSRVKNLNCQHFLSEMEGKRKQSILRNEIAHILAQKELEGLFLYVCSHGDSHNAHMCAYACARIRVNNREFDWWVYAWILSVSDFRDHPGKRTNSANTVLERSLHHCHPCLGSISVYGLSDLFKRASKLATTLENVLYASTTFATLLTSRSHSLCSSFTFCVCDNLLFLIVCILQLHFLQHLSILYLTLGNNHTHVFLCSFNSSSVPVTSLLLLLRQPIGKLICARASLVGLSFSFAKQDRWVYAHASIFRWQQLTFVFS